MPPEVEADLGESLLVAVAAERGDRPRIETGLQLVSPVAEPDIVKALSSFGARRLPAIADEMVHDGYGGCDADSVEEGFVRLSLAPIECGPYFPSTRFFYRVHDLPLAVCALFWCARLYCGRR